ncbi:MAG: FeoB-associated Cys-rich membrane protein [Oscillospiraceae bacterium]
MNWQSWLTLAILAAILTAIIVRWIYNKRNGKSSCGCGGNCGACGMGCHRHPAESAADEE